jgi:dimethylargininase
MLTAITREVSPAITRCELTHLARSPIDLELARSQHRAYEELLRGAGCRVERLDAEPDMPDSMFVEDAAVVTGETAIVTRPGAPSRRLETPTVAEALRRYRALQRIEAPATVDGGDVLVAGRRVFVGRSPRTNDEGIGQLRRMLAPYGYETTAVDVRGCLHLKSAVTAVGEALLLVNPDWLPPAVFSSFELIPVHPEEARAANALKVGDRIICASAYPRTAERLERCGLRVWTVDATEAAKAEGALTCCSLIFESDAISRAD